jgi:hypothetical protein
MRATIDFLTSIRYMAADIYMTVGRAKSIEFVQRYVDADVRSAEFQRSLGYVNDMAYKAKMASERNWEGSQASVAGQILRTLGVIGGTQNAPPSNRRYNWQTMYDLFSYPKTAAMVGYIVQVRGK